MRVHWPARATVALIYAALHAIPSGASTNDAPLGTDMSYPDIGYSIGGEPEVGSEGQFADASLPKADPLEALWDSDTDILLKSEHDFPVASDDELADYRGGYLTDSGIRISFGIERATFIDGALQGGTIFQVPPIEVTGRLRTDSAQPEVSQTTLNGLTLENLASSLPVLVQNNLNGANIQIVTLLNAQISGLAALLRSNALRAMMTEQLVQRVR